MKITSMTPELVPAFKEYFRKYAIEQDVSFPPLDDYKAGPDEPAYLLIDENGIIAGAAVLMIHKAYREAGTGRFRMFHCIEKATDYYMMLLTNILKNIDGLEYIYCFVEDKQTATRAAWEKIGFKIRRYSWVLKRNFEDPVLPVYPDGYELKDFREGFDEPVWCEIINESFDGMQGHTRLYPEKIAEWKKDPSYLPDGMKILWHNGKAVGTMALIKEIENGENIVFIESVGLLNSYQGRGLGKNMIRSGIEYGRNNNYAYAMLSVNAENERAADMYIREGFRKEAFIICYSYNLKQN